MAKIGLRRPDIVPHKSSRRNFLKVCTSKIDLMELRDKILSFSCGKSSPALEFFDSKPKRRQRRTKLRLPRLLINTSEVNFEY